MASPSSGKVGITLSGCVRVGRQIDSELEAITLDCKLGAVMGIHVNRPRPNL
jgi:hypothetical protein